MALVTIPFGSGLTGDVFFHIRDRWVHAVWMIRLIRHAAVLVFDFLKNSLQQRQRSRAVFGRRCIRQALVDKRESLWFGQQHGNFISLFYLCRTRTAKVRQPGKLIPPIAA